MGKFRDILFFLLKCSKQNLNLRGVQNVFSHDSGYENQIELEN